MADAFEERLAALFEDAPEASDTSAFLIAVESKIEARRERRRLIGLLVAGGAAASAALFVSATGLAKPFADIVASAGPRIGALLPGLGVNAMQQAEIGWSLLGLAALAAAAGVSRVMETA